MGKNKNHAILRSTCFLLIATCAAISFAGLAACQSFGTQSAETDKDSCTSWPEGVYATAVAHDDGSQTFTVNGVTFKMVRVDGGTFAMGATPEQENDCWDNEKPVHNVTLSSFEMGETEVTQALW
ncbi:MAG: SUMF1/EgtB/PvdO family nonheme iron enzyme, partial [Bacteroidales bacterium]|nr:SUMF1/EgtB/PvdO family nonheme iron enzyme [Bacteroidales bacterium]